MIPLQRWTIVRAALEPLWMDVLVDVDMGAAGVPSLGMDRSTSELVQLIDPHWRVVRGQVATPDTAPGTVSHAWNEHRDTGAFVDLTGDQLGLPPVQLGARPAGYVVKPTLLVQTGGPPRTRAMGWYIELVMSASRSDRDRQRVGLLCPSCGRWSTVSNVIFSHDRPWGCAWCLPTGSPDCPSGAVYGDGEPVASQYPRDVLWPPDDAEPTLDPLPGNGSGES